MIMYICRINPPKAIKGEKFFVKNLPLSSNIILDAGCEEKENAEKYMQQGACMQACAAKTGPLLCIFRACI